MNFSVLMIFIVVAAISVLFGYNEGRRARDTNMNYELGLRTAFEVALVLESANAQGTTKDMDNTQAVTYAASLAATKLQIFRKEAEKSGKSSADGTEKA